MRRLPFSNRFFNRPAPTCRRPSRGSFCFYAPRCEQGYKQRGFSGLLLRAYETPAVYNPVHNASLPVWQIPSMILEHLSSDYLSKQRKRVANKLAKSSAPPLTSLFTTRILRPDFASLYDAAPNVVAFFRLVNRGGDKFHCSPSPLTFT